MRLIDADNMNFSNGINVDGLLYVPFREIKLQPTAYDIDKVVEELEKREEHYVEMLDWQGQSAICDAIEIVKQEAERLKAGGTNDAN